MNKKFEKIELAAQMIVEAAKECRSGGGDMAFVKSILLAGAVNNILSPYLAELGIDCLYTELSKFATKLDGADFDSLGKEEQTREIGKRMGFYTATYNSLKHAGKKYGKSRLPSADLELVTDLEEEANNLIDAALVDFRKLPLTGSQAHEKFSSEFLDLLAGPWNFPPLDTRR